MTERMNNCCRESLHHQAEDGPGGTLWFLLTDIFTCGNCGQKYSRKVLE